MKPSTKSIQAGLRSTSELQRFAAEEVIRAELIKLKAGLKAAGYKTLWIGTQPPGENWGRNFCERNDVMFASPAIRTDDVFHRVPLWDLLHRSDVFEMGCGNGGNERRSDNAFVYLHIPAMFHGRHEL